VVASASGAIGSLSEFSSCDASQARTFPSDAVVRQTGDLPSVLMNKPFILRSISNKFADVRNDELPYIMQFMFRYQSRIPNLI